YIMSSASFEDTAKATLSAAADVGLTKDEQHTVECAWIATGVLPGPCKAAEPPPPPPPPGSGDDSKPSSSSSSDAPSTESDDTTTPAKKKKSPSTTTTESSGCNVGSHGGDAGYGAVLLAGLAFLARRRRQC